MGGGPLLSFCMHECKKIESLAVIPFSFLSPFIPSLSAPLLRSVLLTTAISVARWISSPLFSILFVSLFIKLPCSSHDSAASTLRSTLQVQGGGGGKPASVPLSLCPPPNLVSFFQVSILLLHRREQRSPSHAVGMQAKALSEGSCTDLIFVPP